MTRGILVEFDPNKGFGKFIAEIDDVDIYDLTHSQDHEYLNNQHIINIENDHLVFVAPMSAAAVLTVPITEDISFNWEELRELIRLVY